MREPRRDRPDNVSKGGALSAADRPLHYVCTRHEARGLIASRDRFWISNCGCREARGGCARSRIDVCLYFTPEFPPTGTSWRKASREEAELLLAEAEARGLVTRPFRDEERRARTDGICFCCDDCCAYFLDRSEVCDKGTSIEATDREGCDDCGVCADVCHFGARTMEEGRLVVARDDCYGCGLCVDVCPLGAIQMVPRE